MKNQIKLLPFLLFVAFVVLGYRVNIIGHKSVALRQLYVVQKTAMAADDTHAQTAENEDKDAHGEEGHAADDAHPEEDADEGEAHAAKVQEETDYEDDGGLTEFTDAELEVLQSLSDRREELSLRERELERKEALLKAFEKRVDSKYKIQDEVQTAKAEIEQLVARFNTQEDEKLTSLIKTYEKMKPKDAARIFSNLDEEVLLEIVRGMKESKIAPILASMDAEKAKLVTSELAKPRELPGLVTNSLKTE